MPDEKLVTLVNSEGQTTDKPESEVAAWAARGWHPEGSEERAGRVMTAARTEEEGIAAPTIIGGLRGLSGGFSDVAMRALGGDDARIQLQHMQEDHSTASTVGAIGGTLAGIATGAGPAGWASRAGAATKGAIGGIGGAIAGGAVEGGLFGAQQGVTELALSDQPLTAEHIASTLSSNALLGAGIGGAASGVFAVGERALARAGKAMQEAAAAKSALQDVPPDLAGLDEKGLGDAMANAKTAHTADIAAERQSLEGLRVEQRAEMAAQVRDLHEALAEESPIYHAVTGEDVEKIAGVKDIQVQLAKSFKTMRSQFDDPIGIAKNPDYLLKPLRMRQAALEELQGKTPELQAALAGDARGDALEHVTDALQQTRQQIANIESISGRTAAPVTSGRLTMLESGPSARMQAIDNAREALKRAPDIGLLGKGAKTAAFAGGTALAHMIPGVGIAAPFIGKGASDLVGKAFEKLAGGASAASERTSSALSAFLDVGGKAAQKMAPLPVATATKVLGAVKFGAGPEAASGKLPDLFKARAQELRQQTMYAPDGSTQMRPEARQALAQRLAPIASVNPILADKIETVAARRISYLSSKIPKHPEVGGIQIGPDTWQPSDMQMRSWARTVRAVEDPHGVEERLAHGLITPEDAEAYRTCYPEKFQALQEQIQSTVPTLSKTLPMKRKVALFIFTGVPTAASLQPNVVSVFQNNFAMEKGGGQQAPKPEPQYGPRGSIKSLDKPTPAQSRGA